MLITGDPGGGKSTFLQKIAYWVLDHEQGLPIWISLAQFNENLVADKRVADSGWLFRYLLEKWLKHLSQEGKETPQKWQEKFEELLKARQLWLILDGADEMAVSYALKKIQEQLAKGWANSVNVVLSCRLNLWEQQQKNALSEEFKIYRTLDFNYPEQVHQFIDNWFGKGDVKAIGLKEQLDKDNRIRQQNLVKNPLRLVLLCRIWNQTEGKSLPKTKADFYQFFVKNYYLWKRDANQEFEIPSQTQENLNEKLGELARNAIDRSDARFRLRTSFIEKYLGSSIQLDSLFSWALKLGWLLHVGYPTEEEENSYEKEKSTHFFIPHFRNILQPQQFKIMTFSYPVSIKIDLLKIKKKIPAIPDF